MFGIPDADLVAKKVLMILEMREKEKDTPMSGLIDKLSEQRQMSRREAEVEKMLRHLASCGYGYTEIVQKMNAAGLRSTLGGHFYPATIRKLANTYNIKINTRNKRGRKSKSVKG